MYVERCGICDGPKVFRKSDDAQVVWCSCDTRRSLTTHSNDTVIGLFEKTLTMVSDVMLLYKAMDDRNKELMTRLERIENAQLPIPPVDTTELGDRIEQHHAEEAFDEETRLLAPDHQPVLHRGGTVGSNRKCLSGPDVPECSEEGKREKQNPNTND